MSFNSKQYKESQSHGNTESMLRNKSEYNINKDLGENNPDTITDNQLELNRKESSHTLYENQLDNSRTGSAETVVENGLDTSEKMYNDKRNKKVWNTKIKPNDSLAQAYDNHKKEVFDETEKNNKAAQQIDEETAFWDEYVGVQMLGKQTKIVSNSENSQLQNDSSRFVNLDKIKISVDPNETIDSVLEDQNKFKKMVMASLQDADALIFGICKKASDEKRELSIEEQQQIKDINSGKARILAGHIELTK